LANAVGALVEYTARFEPANMSPRSERAKAAAEAGNAFLKLYSEKKIYLPPATTQKLDEIRNELKMPFAEFQTTVDGRADYWNKDATEAWMRIASNLRTTADVALASLESDFRSLLGYDPS
jgi:hypothetical protein